jgi:dipeptidyl aminopeptidase/acylaminoacyl peptidase
VPFEQSRALFAALRAHEVPAHFITYDGGHSLASVNLEQRRAIWSQAPAFFIAQERL